MMMILARFNSIAARIAISIILAVFLSIVTIIGFDRVFSRYLWGDGDAARRHLILSKSQVAVINAHNNPMMVSGGMAAIIRAVASAPSSERQRIVAAMTRPDMNIALGDAAHADTVANKEEGVERLRQLIEMQLETFAIPILVGAEPLSEDHDRSRRGKVTIYADLPDGQRIVFTVPDYPRGSGYGLLIFSASIVFIAIIVSIWTARRLARPIREFARASERLGVDLTAPPLAVRGPQELRAAIRTFNRMQDRLRRFLEDRTQMLAAISHDLRAPLAPAPARRVSRGR
jgi:hypothetical protein